MIAAEETKKLSHNEVIKDAIPTLAGTIAQTLADPTADHFSDDDGQFLASTFMDYLVPTSLDLPHIEIEHLEYEPQGEVAYRGVGEGGAIGAPAALCNAIEDALAPLCVRINEQYLPPSRILELIATIDRDERGTG